MERVVAVEHLRKTYREVIAVDDVTLEIDQNEIYGIIGPNGSGKTTTVEILQGLRQPDGGAIRVLGLDPRTQGEELRRRIGSQLQESALPDRIKVWEALDLFATAAGRNHRDWHEAARQWGIYDRRNAAFANLSGGQRQRLFIALALVTDPVLVFLDEMTTGLDPAARRVAWELIRSVRERGATILLVTHFMDEVEHLCDRVSVFQRGRIVRTDSPSGLVQKHRGVRTVRFSMTERDLEWLSRVPDVDSFESEGDHVLVRGTNAVLAHVGAALVARGITPPDLRVDLPTLEDVYMSLVEANGP
ncbi:MAG: ABC transporter ATP-binding protein [Chloroflexi bacterium]|nr:ABC transporter ATP-binding protein [Chloroflexota bacterium]